MVLDDAISSPSTYACMNPNHFVSTEPFAPLAQFSVAVAPADGQYANWLEAPQEDEFAWPIWGSPRPT